MIREYYVNITDMEAGVLQQFSSRSQELEATNLHPYHTYELSVAAYTVTLGPYSEKLYLTTLEDGKLHGKVGQEAVYTHHTNSPMQLQVDHLLILKLMSPALVLLLSPGIHHTYSSRMVK